VTRRLADLAWPDVAEVASRSLLAIPLGSTEQHGPHLPCTTDTDLAVALTDALAARRDDVVVAPPLAYGSAGEHAAFPGTLSIGGPAFEQVVVELGRSADAFAGVVFVSAHGGNADALARAVAVLRGEGRRAMVWSPVVAGGDAHAGRTETSMLLALRPEAVDLERATPGDTRPIRDLLPLLRAGGVAAIAPNGVLGDPLAATAESGSVLVRSLADDLVAAVEAFA